MKNFKTHFTSISFVLLSHLVFFAFAFGQIPSGYYNSANGLEEDALKDALNDIIDDHTVFPYSSGGTDVWDILKETDKDTTNPNKVILLYTGWTMNANAEYNGGNGWNREHVWAKSHGNFGTSPGPGTDVHMLRPCDITVNAARGNRYFGEGDTPYTDPDGPTDCKTNSSLDLWEPRDEVKGDVARMMFYMATRYEGENGEVDLQLVDFIPTSAQSSQPIHGVLSVLLQWHHDDPVDDWERNRNNIIYNDYQHNRNPFIDHPEYANLIWGSGTSKIDKEENNSGKKNVIRITDYLGREVKPKKQTPLIYFYSDGTIKKRILE